MTTGEALGIRERHWGPGEALGTGRGIGDRERRRKQEAAGNGPTAPNGRVAASHDWLEARTAEAASQGGPGLPLDNQAGESRGR